MTMHGVNAQDARMESAVEILPDTLFAVGGCISTETSLPWTTVNATGWLPFQCYALKSEGQVVLVDGGLAVHRKAIAAGLAPLLNGSRRRTIMLTRRDVDCIINLPWLLRSFTFDMIHLGSGDLSPLDFFAAFDHASAEAQLYAVASPIPVEWVAPGKIVRIGALQFENLRTSMRVLATTWLYEATTRTLFSSDSFGFLTRAEPGGPTAVTPRDDQLSTDAIIDFLNAKFDWLCGIDTSAIVNDLRALQNEKPIDRVCPSYGCVIEGQAVVQLLFARTMEALQILSKRGKPSVLAGFDWARYPGER